MHICIQTGDKDKNKPFIPSIASAMYVCDPTLATIHLHFYFLLRRSNVLSKINFHHFLQTFKCSSKIKEVNLTTV